MKDVCLNELKIEQDVSGAHPRGDFVIQGL